MTLQGFGFQPDLNVFVQLGNSTIAGARTDQDGNFTNTFYIPVTSEGAQTMTVLDESGNAASTSYFTEFGFGTIQQQLDDMSRQIQDLQNGQGGAPSVSPPSGSEPSDAP